MGSTNCIKSVIIFSDRSYEMDLNVKVHSLFYTKFYLNKY